MEGGKERGEEREREREIHQTMEGVIFINHTTGRFSAYF